MSSPQASFPRRGEVYWLDFAPATGQEMTGWHPCVIVQNDVGNQHSALTIGVAVTTNLRVASLPVGVFLPAGEGGLPQDAVAHCGHIYTLDKPGSVRNSGNCQMLAWEKSIGRCGVRSDFEPLAPFHIERWHTDVGHTKGFPTIHGGRRSFDPWHWGRPR